MHLNLKGYDKPYSPSDHFMASISPYNHFRMPYTMVLNAFEALNGLISPQNLRRFGSSEEEENEFLLSLQLFYRSLLHIFFIGAYYTFFMILL